MLELAFLWLQQADPYAVYGFLFLIAFLENVFPPIPGDLPVAFIGSLISLSPITFAGALVSASLGSTVGFMLLFLLSRHFGIRLYAEGETTASHWLSRGAYRLFPPSGMVALRRKYAAHGYIAVLVNRFLFGSRAVISIMAGLMHLKVMRVLGAAMVSAFAWNVLLLYSGSLLGDNWQHIDRYATLFSLPVTGGIVLLLIFSLWRYMKRRKQRED
ncbi:DedA family protein [Chlorobium phaeovibrioides]|uniref:DedA family protein n=1 Tax=Chlorobium phaeovibrioides TaxID=1094 RepID=A0ABW9ULZ3_CHLPH|nr:DedA family protein [Chlorobium phaeovibrioides]MWV54085.1 DedA family protein [Chlorobium phaeovibrioides]